MPFHRLNSYFDGYKRVTYCEACSREDPEIDMEECPGKPGVPLKRSYQASEDQPELFPKHGE